MWVQLVPFRSLSLFCISSKGHTGEDKLWTGTPHITIMKRKWEERKSRKEISLQMPLPSLLLPPTPPCSVPQHQSWAIQQREGSSRASWKHVCTKQVGTDGLCPPWRGSCSPRLTARGHDGPRGPWGHPEAGWRWKTPLQGLRGVKTQCSAFHMRDSNNAKQLRNTFSVSLGKILTILKILACPLSGILLFKKLHKSIVLSINRGKPSHPLNDTCLVVVV